VSETVRATFRRVGANGALSDPPLKVLINPTDYTLDKGAQIAEITIPGLDSPVLQFVHGNSETLSLTLLFDTTDGGMGDNVTPVTTETDKFYELIKIDGDLHAPPVVVFSWGESGFPGSLLGDTIASQRRQGFKCVVTSVRQQFTLFSPKGVPLRATLTVALKEYKTLGDQIRELNLRTSDHTQVHVVQQGETLSGISNQLYGDPASWRAIAEANNIDDPLALAPGFILEVPPLG
jgi:hypothetical protein